MLGPYERAEVCRLVHREFVELEMMARNHGGYHYLCHSAGLTFLSHQPVGQVLRSFTADDM